MRSSKCCNRPRIVLTLLSLASLLLFCMFYLLQTKDSALGGRIKYAHPYDPYRLDVVVPGEQHFYLKAASPQERQEWLVALGSVKTCLNTRHASQILTEHDELKRKQCELRLYCDLLVQQVHSIKTAVVGQAVPDVEKLDESTALLGETCDTLIRTLEDCVRAAAPPSAADFRCRTPSSDASKAAAKGKQQQRPLKDSGRRRTTSGGEMRRRGGSESEAAAAAAALNGAAAVAAGRMSSDDHSLGNNTDEPSPPSSSADDDDDDGSFHTFFSENNASRARRKRRSKRLEQSRAESSGSTSAVVRGSGDAAVIMSPRVHRSSIPPKPESQLLLWSFVKANFARLHKLELTRITLPVQLNEPLSILQRCTEKFEFADILDAAAQEPDASLQMAQIAAFIVSGWGYLHLRLNKPFNPMLGETFECDRRHDLGWRSVSEQISHHPPVLATWAEGGAWSFFDEMAVMSKYQMQGVHVLPSGGSVLSLSGQGHAGEYVWHKAGVRTELTGIFFGPLSVNQHGSFQLHDSRSEYACHVDVGSKRSLEGVVKDAEGRARWLLRGAWNSHVDAAKVLSEKRRAGRSPHYETEKPFRLWQLPPLPTGADRTYNLSTIAMQMNEMEEDMAPTDSRRRPDIRLLEEGDVDGAAAVKLRLEDAQRKRLAHRGDPEPTWFSRLASPSNPTISHRYTHAYWDAKAAQDWTGCPSIF